MKRADLLRKEIRLIKKHINYFQNEIERMWGENFDAKKIKLFKDEIECLKMELHQKKIELREVLKEEKGSGEKNIDKIGELSKNTRDLS